MDVIGNIASTAAHLTALATMDMPEEVHAMQQYDTGKLRFGIVDVVVTSGYGRKVTSGTGYLLKPRDWRTKDSIPMTTTKQQIKVRSIAAVAKT